MYPNDDICQYLYYTDVVIVDGKIRPSLERNSWNQFQIMAKAYSKVKSGIAFDHWHVTPQLVHNAKVELDKLARNKIGSYGLLNVIRKPNELKDVVQAMKPVIEETHWPLVNANATYANAETLRGLSFEMGTLIYVLEKDAASLRDGAYAKCVDFGMTTRDVANVPSLIQLDELGRPPPLKKSFPGTGRHSWRWNSRTHKGSTVR
ncbi:hypothetical protein HPB52_012361 [Rhipicephalus sanguineus]|uniref:Uncharacterized protein n=1 Tax=Rhipicephalus sanguineus TaxID=34632 RepID=A0A9D4PVU7_RHISA|nr:hypothetical protein HPB52_012361 [Rhipicephalus sanguineus]